MTWRASCNVLDVTITTLQTVSRADITRRSIGTTSADAANTQSVLARLLCHVGRQAAGPSFPVPQGFQTRYVVTPPDSS